LGNLRKATPVPDGANAVLPTSWGGEKLGAKNVVRQKRTRGGDRRDSDARGVPAPLTAGFGGGWTPPGVFKEGGYGPGVPKGGQTEKGHQDAARRRKSHFGKRGKSQKCGGLRS